MKKFLIGLLVLTAVLVVSGWGLVKYNNRRVSPDYYETHYKIQDTVPQGKVGVFITGLVVPPTFKQGERFFYNVTFKIYKNIIPWPFRLFSYMDKGIALLDSTRYHEHDEFTPTRLVDAAGSDTDIDGVAYIDKYKAGAVEWAPPSKRIHLDHGYFIYTGRKAGYPTLTGKTLVKARVWYYDKGIEQEELPHWKGTFDIVDGAVAKLKEKYTGVEYRSECSMFYDSMKAKLWEMLDAGCETIVLAAPMAIYSHFEEFNSSFYHSIEYIHEWEQEHPGKKIKIIMAPPMGNFKSLRQAYLDMLRDRLDSLPEDAKVLVAVTVHGMPWDHFQWEAWLKMAPAYRDVLHDEVKALLKSYKFSRAETIVCQDEYAGPVWDKENKYLSTNEVYWDGIEAGYDYIIGLPIEFTAENSDTLFHHALKNFDGFDEYDVYAKIDYPDWSVPYTQTMTQGKTKIIYNGVPVGKYQHHVIDSLYQSIDSILSKRAGADQAAGAAR